MLALIALACPKWIVVMLANAFPASRKIALQEACDFYVPGDRSPLT
jgi:hypothetical protein